MKKIAILLVLSTLLGIFALSCNKSNKSDEDQSTLESEQTTVDTDNLDEDDEEKVREGYTMVSTKYSANQRIVAKVVFDEAYGADPTGKKDMSSLLQQAVYVCATGGGGTLYIPSGKYLITQNIKVPLGVVICGDWQKPNIENPEYGTVILAKTKAIAAKDSKDAGALFTMASNTGIIGLTIYYPEQDSSSIKPYGFSIYFNDGDYNYTNTLKNITLVNSYRGISLGAKYDSERHGTHQIENIYMCTLETGIEMHGCMDTGFTTGINISSDYWTKAGWGFSEKSANAEQYCRKNATGMIFGDLDLDMFADINISGCKVGISFQNLTSKRDSAFWGNLYDINIKDCDYGIDIVNMSSGNSALISKGSIAGSVFAIRNGERRIPLRLCNIELKGETSGYILSDDEYVPSGFEFSDYYAGSHFTPSENLYVVPIDGYNKQKKDFAPVIQETLNAAAATGGIVYIPAGVFSLYSSVTVPEGVQLLGSTPIVQRDTKWRNVTGTVLLSYVSDISTIVLKKNAGVVGLRLWDMVVSSWDAFDNLEKGVNDPKIDIALIKGVGSGVYVTDCTLVAGYMGIDFRNCDGHMVNHVVGQAYISLIVAGGKNGYIGQTHCNYFANDNNLSQYFDTKYVTLSEWEDKPDNNLFQRVYRIAYKLVDAENEYVANIGNYGARCLFSTDNSTATFINVGVDTIKNGNFMFEVSNSTVDIVNAMRVFGGSVKIDDTSTIRIMNRNDRNNVSEAPYNSEISREDVGVRVYEGEDVRKQIFNCDTLPSGMYGPVSVTTKEGEFKEGVGAWKITPNDNLLFSYKFSSTVDISTQYESGGYLHMWIYVENAAAVINSSESQFELTSCGTCDCQEINWNLAKHIKSDGWNEVYLPFDSAGITKGGKTNVNRGDFVPEKMNYIRVYIKGAAGYTFIIDDVYVCMKK